MNGFLTETFDHVVEYMVEQIGKPSIADLHPNVTVSEVVCNFREIVGVRGLHA